jgi:hypothetical protein
MSVTSGIMPVRANITSNILGIISWLIGEASEGINLKMMAKRKVGTHNGWKSSETNRANL